MLIRTRRSRIRRAPRPTAPRPPPASDSRLARAIREAVAGFPVVLFPGSAMQLTEHADLILFLSLVSGRNPQYLIEEHVRAVPFLDHHRVPTLSTAYILIDGGRVTSVEAVSQTRPLPADKPELAAAHVKAARLIGMQAVYLEAGSGATRPVAPEIIRACRAAAPAAPAAPAADVALFVGGGIRTPDQARAARAPGGAHHGRVVAARLGQRWGVGGGVRPPARRPGPPGRRAVAALDERREPQRDPRRAGGARPRRHRRRPARQERRPARRIGRCGARRPVR